MSGAKPPLQSLFPHDRNIYPYYGELKRGFASLPNSSPPLLEKERGTKGVRLIKTTNLAGVL